MAQDKLPAPARGRLPALDSLRAFEAAARRLSFTQAAGELYVTQGAVSQRIKALEKDLEVQLFRRLTRRLELTPEGERLALGVREGLERIVNAIADVDSNAKGRALTVSVLPSFAARWLMPRLPRFHELHPEIDVQVVADGRPLDLDLTGLDTAIRFGHGKYPGLQTMHLMPDSIVPVCSPKLLADRTPIRTIADLMSLPLLHDTPTESDHSKSDWASWLAHVGAPPMQVQSGLRFNQADMVIEAAVLGLGVALARTSLLADDLTNGRLVYAYPQAAPTAFNYYFICRRRICGRPCVVRFREWLVAEVDRHAGSQVPASVQSLNIDA
jgi:LysR family transcriptional regulator, glycine cleavage system transcriptional activator